MKKILLVPDSFKGTLTSKQICQITTQEIHEIFPDAEICAIPVADGGEGTVDAFISAVDGKKIKVPCKGPYMENVDGFYGLLSDGTAIIEMAAAAGLPLVGENRHAEKTTTYGVGELIADATNHGAKRIVLALGGSATNDGGCGAAVAVGVQFLDKYGKSFIPVGETLGDIEHISLESMNPKVRDISFTTMCDIDNPLCGSRGASAVFGPQKGASQEMVQMLDQNLRHLAEVIKKDLGKDVLNVPGAGAAGGFGAGSIAFFNSHLEMGIDTVLQVTEFDKKLQGTDLVITGEGKLDSQSLSGKVVIGVARKVKPHGIPVVAIVGGSETEIESVYAEGVAGIFSINPLPLSFEEVKKDCEKNLRFTIRNLFNFIKVLQSK